MSTDGPLSTRHRRELDDPQVRLPSRDEPGRYVLAIPEHVHRVGAADGRRWVRNTDPDTQSMGQWCELDRRGRVAGDPWHTVTLLDTHAPLVEW
jgi:hypothetical protein